MMLLARIAVWSLLGFGVLLFAIQLAAHEVGFWLGRRQATKQETAREGVGVLVGGLRWTPKTRRLVKV